MKEIVLQFSTKNGVIPALIRTRTNSKYSHVDSCVHYLGAPDDLLGAQFFFEKSKSGVMSRKENYDNFTRKTQVTLSVTDDQFIFYWTFLAKQLGKPYDLTAVFGLATHRDWREQDAWFCSELIAAALEYAGIIHFTQEVNWISPENLFEVVCAAPVYVKTEEINSAA